MSLSDGQRNEVADLLATKIREKLERYDPEPHSMPFHMRLLGGDRLAVFSFVQSFNTTLGTSVFEQVATIVARPNFARAEHQYKGLNHTISPAAQVVIEQIMNDLRKPGATSDKAAETRKVLAVASATSTLPDKRPTVDLFLEAHDGSEYYIDLKTAKPNMSDFSELKRQLLRWIAMRGAVDPNVSVYTMLAIPYNPYAPKPYDRWTLQALFDRSNEILVAGAFWDFLGGDGTYGELLGVFEKAGLALRDEIDERFAALR